MYAEMNAYAEKINKLVSKNFNKGFAQDYTQAIIEKSGFAKDFFQDGYGHFDSYKYMEWHDFEMSEENQLTDEEISALPAMSY